MNADQLKRLRPDPEAQFHYRQDRAKIVDFSLENKGVKRGILQVDLPVSRNPARPKKFKKTKGLRECVSNGWRRFPNR